MSRIDDIKKTEKRTNIRLQNHSTKHRIQKN